MFDLIKFNLDFIDKIKFLGFLKKFIFILLFVLGFSFLLLLIQNIIIINNIENNLFFKTINNTIIFIFENYKNIFYMITIFSIILIIIDHPKNYREFTKRIYEFILDEIEKERYINIKDKLFVVTDKNGKWIQFLIKNINQNIHFELYIMDFSKEKKKGDLIYEKEKKGDLYFQFALHFENITENQIDIIRKKFEKNTLMYFE